MRIVLTMLFVALLFINKSSTAQQYLKNWYFGTGTDGLVFNGVNAPVKVSDKVSGLGFEGMIVVNNPVTGDLLFYSDGDRVVNKNHTVMTNGSGMTGHFSGAQCVQSCPVPGACAQKFYLFTNSASDNTAGAISYSIVDFTVNPLGEVTDKNTPLWSGPSDEAMCLVNKPGSYDYWLINNEFSTATYRVWPVTTAGIGTPVTYTFSNTGESYQMNYDNVTGRIAVTGGGNKKLTLLNFNATTGVLSNEVQLAAGFQGCGATRFSPDGTKIYAGIATNAGGNPVLYQYDFNTSAWTSMNTCCYAHDLKMGPDGKMYHIHTYNVSQPMAVIDFPNLSAVGNACNYHTITFNPAFNGEVRRFPEFVILPEPPVAHPDIVGTAGTPITIPVLANDTDPQNDPFSLDAIIRPPVFGNAVISGNNITYSTLNAATCGKTDTLIYRVKDINCDVDTALVLVNYPACTQVQCNNWLSTPTQGSYVTVGDVDVAGTQLTVEAMVNRAAPLNSGLYYGHLVSKHTGPTNVNYALLPNGCEITTSVSGYTSTFQACPPDLNKTYHVAMVYNGATLKFYRNGFLLSQTPCTGNIVTNDLLTTIAQVSSSGNPPNNQMLGYINEVRIWNIARSQTEIRNFMNSSLPNPATTPGLLAYYTFDNLQNKQGNAAYNGTLNGGAIINVTNPNCNFVADSCQIPDPGLNCRYWPVFGANNLNAPIPNGNTLNFSFSNPAHLLANTAYNTLTPGNYFTPNPTIATTSPPNGTAHNPASIGAITLYPMTTGEQGTISFASPVTTGFYLHIYQTVSRLEFDQPFTLISSDGDLTVGNSGALTSNVIIPGVGPAQSPDDANATIYFPPGISQIKFTVNNAQPILDGIKLAFTFPDNCVSQATISNIINLYTPVLALNPCNNQLTVEDATGYNVGDTVLMIQMKGAIIDSTNTAAFGTITDYKSAGNYEFNYVAAKNGNIITLKNKLLRTYEVPNGKVQLIRVPYYENVAVTGTLTCAPWDGSRGGVLVFNVKDTVTLNAGINVKGKGFRGGTISNNPDGGCGTGSPDYFYPLTQPGGSWNSGGAEKGEGIANFLSPSRMAGKGALGNGGGGGNKHNTGGGGGSSFGAGGKGGNALEGCTPATNGGIGGVALTTGINTGKVFLGGGGGCGDINNNVGTRGVEGGGIVLIQCGYLQSNNQTIDADGNSQLLNGTGIADGAGGGGGGGTVLLSFNNQSGNLSINSRGGNGGNQTPNFGCVGPGGGGGGGLVYLNTPTAPASFTIATAGGAAGVVLATGFTCSNTTYGAAPGANGGTLFNLALPVNTNPFKPNIDSVRIKDSTINCSSFDFKGLAYTNTVGIQSWQWSFGDGNTANTQNTSHTYANTGPYTVKLVVTDINGCKDSITTNINAQSVSADFAYKFNPCSPLTVQFESGIAGINIIDGWSMGDGNTYTGISNPVHTYPGFGNYVVQYITGNAFCRDTVTKTLSLQLQNNNALISTADTTICKGSGKQLLTRPALSFCWSPTTWLSNPLSPTPVATPQQSITYYYTAEVTGPSLVTNGDFSAGNTGFTSQYNFAPNNTTEGEYFVGTSPQAWNASLSNCPDHTTGTGNMLLVNGSPVNGITVWSQTITITPNTNYAFSAWLQALWPPNPAQLQFSINGKNIGQVFNASLPTCTWRQFYYNWNSGSNTTATISIVNRNTQIQGNDFALDDISFAPVFLQRDSVTITLDSALVRTSNDTTLCAGTSMQLSSTGGVSYSWTPPAGLSNPGIANPVATPTANTQYIVTGTNANGCSAKDTVNIAVTPLPVVTVTNDTVICKNTSVQLTASGGTTYAWTPSATLSNPAIANPVASPAGTTTYYVTVSNAGNLCSSRDSVTVAIRPNTVFRQPPGKVLCDNTTAQLDGNNSPAFQYQWSPALYLSNAQTANPLFTPGASTAYTLLVTEPVCGDDSLFTVPVIVNPSPTITADKSNDIDCAIRSAQLNASGAFSYVWTPAAGLSNPNIASPVAITDTTTTYLVQGTNGFGCTGSDTVTVAVTADGKGLFELPSAFTPNGDGRNDCFGITNWGRVELIEFAVYNRWGERVWRTTNPNECWDGLYKGQPQPGATFVYFIRAKSNCGNIFRKGTVILIR